MIMLIIKIKIIYLLVSQLVSVLQNDFIDNLDFANS